MQLFLSLVSMSAPYYARMQCFANNRKCNIGNLIHYSFAVRKYNSNYFSHHLYLSVDNCASPAGSVGAGYL